MSSKPLVNSDSLTAVPSSGAITIQTSLGGTSVKLENTTSGGSANAFYPTASSGLDLGSSTARWASLYMGDGTNIDFATSSTAKVKMDGSGNTVRPSITSGLDLGSSSFRWSTIYAANALNTSDARAKENVQNCELGLEFIKSLRPVSYSWKSGVLANSDTMTKRYGFIAQEVEQIAPAGCIVDKGKSSDDMMGIAYNEIIAPLVKAVQEQQAQIEELKSQLAAMK